MGEQPLWQTQGLPCSQNPLMWARSSGTKCQSVTLTPQTPWEWESGGPENHGGCTEGAERLSMPRTRPGLHSGFRTAPPDSSPRPRPGFVELELAGAAG